jgi:hypothetical protein
MYLYLNFYFNQVPYDLETGCPKDKPLILHENTEYFKTK